MGKYDDFDLDLDKVKGTLNNVKGGTLTCLTICLECAATLMTKCAIVSCNNYTCGCISTPCSDSDATGCRNGGNTELLRC